MNVESRKQRDDYFLSSLCPFTLRTTTVETNKQNLFDYSTFVFIRRVFHPLCSAAVQKKNSKQDRFFCFLFENIFFLFEYRWRKVYVCGRLNSIWRQIQSYHGLWPNHMFVIFFLNGGYLNSVARKWNSNRVKKKLFFSFLASGRCSTIKQQQTRWHIE